MPVHFTCNDGILRRYAALLGHVLVLLAVTAWAYPLSHAATCVAREPLRGLNLAGAEFAPEKRPGKIDVDYMYPNESDINFVAQHGFNVIRLPILWERLQPKAGSAFAADELARLRKVISLANRKGICVIVDLHNYGAYQEKPLGSSDMPLSALVDFWRRMAVIYGDEPAVAFGLMNEPHRMAVEKWVEVARRTVTDLRRRGSRNLILVSGGRWSGAHDWESDAGGLSNARALRSLHDPRGRLLIEVHQYADSDYSGKASECVEPERLRQYLDRVAAWADKNGHRLFLGEFGAAANEGCIAALDAMLSGTESAPWHGWTYWAAGRWLGDYPYNVHPAGSAEPPQMSRLKRYVATRQRDLQTRRRAGTGVAVQSRSTDRLKGGQEWR